MGTPIRSSYPRGHSKNIFASDIFIDIIIMNASHSVYGSFCSLSSYYYCDQGIKTGGPSWRFSLHTTVEIAEMGTPIRSSYPRGHSKNIFASDIFIDIIIMNASHSVYGSFCSLSSYYYCDQGIKIGGPSWRFSLHITVEIAEMGTPIRSSYPRGHSTNICASDIFTDILIMH